MNIYKDIIKSTLILISIITLIVSAVIVVYNYTYVEPVEGLSGKAITAAKELLNTEQISDIKIDGLDESVKAIGKDENGNHAVYLSIKGYAGNGSIEMVVAVNSENQVIGVQIISNKDTPGLGTKVNDTDFLDSFTEKSADSISTENIDTIAGATISSKAVIEGVNTALQLTDDR